MHYKNLDPKPLHSPLRAELEELRVLLWLREARIRTVQMGESKNTRNQGTSPFLLLGAGAATFIVWLILVRTPASSCSAWPTEPRRRATAGGDNGVSLRPSPSRPIRHRLVAPSPTSLAARPHPLPPRPVGWPAQTRNVRGREREIGGVMTWHPDIWALRGSHVDSAATSDKTGLKPPKDLK
uniref:Uncharacterized protein n=1 Tax=Oryza barthii TaxID=65489 RepID=A0A0D3GBY4_9ORYZ